MKFDILDVKDILINELVKFIKNGSVADAERIARNLAHARANVDFSLLNINDSEEKNVTQTKPAEVVEESSDSVLHFTLCIESSINNDPIRVPIYVNSGATLESLKKQIEEKTGLSCSHQYWFACKRYPISNDYVFGSSTSIESNANQPCLPAKLIKSGDTLFMYISEESSMSKF